MTSAEMIEAILTLRDMVAAVRRLPSGADLAP